MKKNIILTFILIIITLSIYFIFDKIYIKDNYIAVDTDYDWVIDDDWINFSSWIEWSWSDNWEWSSSWWTESNDNPFNL